MLNFGLALFCLVCPTCHSYDVIKQLSKLHEIVEYSFLFPLVQEL